MLSIVALMYGQHLTGGCNSHDPTGTGLNGSRKTVVSQFCNSVSSLLNIDERSQTLHECAREGGIVPAPLLWPAAAACRSARYAAQSETGCISALVLFIGQLRSLIGSFYRSERAQDCVWWRLLRDH